ncbi:hypothetical protein [Mycobacterium noviomagense]|uniref:Transmembrane protein n=1 Tax=Mycobacterium noviomagense TaxID=459858 RepID=A0A7I7PEL2_9MYCO|nr:hypothetical protein [Mycobacterium noviomagense]ORB14453.1 hypothetical protein BST37_11125 [Mycobacterium noviomagense]BBY06939.1 hypothetical protein MNVI_22570 [Mycobacterium noviomagense]
MADDESQPKTEPYTPSFDTGAFSQPLKSPDASEATNSGRHAEAAPVTGSQTTVTTGDFPPLEPIPAVSSPSEPIKAPAQPVAVPGRYYFLKWWKFVLLVAAVWVVAAPIGLGLFYWWYHSIDKTPAVFVVLVYVVVCTVGSLMLAMVQDRPLLSALAIAVMSALFASFAAAAPLYGYYYCQRMPHCLVGIIPY